MPTWESGFVEANGLRLHYTRTGGKLPPVVLAHGFSDDGLCWTPVAEALAPDYDVVMVDARGHGRSDAPEQGYSPTDHAADLAGAIRALGLERPAILGHPAGGPAGVVDAGEDGCGGGERGALGGDARLGAGPQAQDARRVAGRGARHQPRLVRGRAGAVG
ncbi:MAG TPA: alpha/beta hydrolase [Roseiflexaceae bacterium]|nr:alpha/beta hydrolase [Roseiflexaceae bacterium]